MTNEMLDIIEQLMGGHKNTTSAQAARAVLVDGLTRPQAQEQYGVSRPTLARAIQHREAVLTAALQLAELAKKQ